jgi:hypothetical protein
MLFPFLVEFAENGLQNKFAENQNKGVLLHFRKK